MKAMMPTAAAASVPAFTGLKANSTMVRTRSHCHRTLHIPAPNTGSTPSSRPAPLVTGQQLPPTRARSSH
jgi:hypothetical protein